MQQPSEPEAQIMTLREHLLNSQQQGGSGGPSHDGMHAAASHDHHIDPAIAGPGYPVPINDGGVDDTHEVRKGRRELSTSKRAAQNRAAQRAFRQRKEAYINSLQEKVKEYEAMISSYKAVQQENFQLREYIIQLQARLLEAHGEVPPPPSHINLENPPQRPGETPAPAQAEASSAGAAPTAPMSSNAVEELRLAAAQAAAQAAQTASSNQAQGQEQQASSAADRK